MLAKLAAGIQPVHTNNLAQRRQNGRLYHRDRRQ
jgi:hypothetical protein